MKIIFLLIFYALFVPHACKGQNAQSQGNPVWKSIISKDDRIESVDRVRRIVYYYNCLYVLADFYRNDCSYMNTVEGLMEWDGKTWSTVGNNQLTKHLNCIAINGNELYVSVNCKDVNDTKDDDYKGGYLAKWDGNKWDSIGGYLHHRIYNLITFKNELYASVGDFDVIKVPVRIIRWNGLKWDTIASIKMNNASAPFFVVFKDELYLGGSYDTINGRQKTFVKWNGNDWSTVDGANIYDITSMTVYNGELIVGAYFIGDDYAKFNNIGRWDGVKWQTLGEGLKTDNNRMCSVFSMAEFEGELYVAGGFDKAGDKPAYNLAKWNGTRWDAVKGGKKLFEFINVNGKLYAVGYFNKGKNKKFLGVAALEKR